MGKYELATIEAGLEVCHLYFLATLKSYNELKNGKEKEELYDSL